jgi:hypothetical protein
VTRHPRAPFIALTRLLQRRYPELEDPPKAVLDGRVIVDGRTITNPRARVRADASIRVLGPRRLRGDLKVAAALDAFSLDVKGVVAVDVGAAAGGFTAALLDRGAERVYAVDVGFGQLIGRLRLDRRVINLERTNVAAIDDHIIPEVVDLVTVDVSYLPVAQWRRFAGFGSHRRQGSSLSSSPPSNFGPAHSSRMRERSVTPSTSPSRRSTRRTGEPRPVPSLLTPAQAALSKRSYSPTESIRAGTRS